MSEEKIQKCIDSISDFYFGDTEDSGEALFKNFAEAHRDKFLRTQEEMLLDEHKLEYTEVYKEFQKYRKTLCLTPP